jgi:hypothetical protein
MNKMTLGPMAVDGFAERTAWVSGTDGFLARDLSGNGVTDASELKTLAETGITSISLATTVPTIAIAIAIANVILTNTQIETKYLGDGTVSAAATALHTNLHGYGTVKNLDVAMTSDATLLAMVTSFKALPATTSWADYKNAADDILFRWAGVSSVTPTAMTALFDQQKLAFLEAIGGTQLTPRDGLGVPVLANDNTLMKIIVRQVA